MCLASQPALRVLVQTRLKSRGFFLCLFEPHATYDWGVAGRPACATLPGTGAWSTSTTRPQPSWQNTGNAAPFSQNGAKIAGFIGAGCWLLGAWVLGAGCRVLGENTSQFLHEKVFSHFMYGCCVSIPTINLHDAIVKQCGPPSPTSACWGRRSHFCCQCASVPLRVPGDVHSACRATPSFPFSYTHTDTRARSLSLSRARARTHPLSHTRAHALSPPCARARSMLCFLPLPLRHRCLPPILMFRSACQTEPPSLCSR